MAGRLTIQLPARPVVVVDLRPDREVVIGRDAECDVVLDDDRISRRHAAISRQDGQWTVCDLGSKNGSFVDADRVSPAAGSTLASGCWLSLGGVPARFELVAEAIDDAPQTRWRTSLELQRALEPSAGVGPMLSQVLASVLELGGLERGFVLLGDAPEDLEIRALRGLEASSLADTAFGGSVSVVRRVLETASSTVCVDTRADSSLGARQSVVVGGIGALVCVPLIVGQRVLGAVYADSPNAVAGLSELELSLLEALCSHAALALEVARLDTELTRTAGELAGADPAAAERLASELAASRLGSRPGTEGGLRWRDVVSLHGEPS